MMKNLTATKSLQYFAIGLAFSLPISRAGISLFTGLIFVTWLWEGNFKSKWEEIKSVPIFWSITAFVGYMTFTLLWTNNLQEGDSNLRNYYYYFPLVFIFFTSLKKDTVQMALSAFILGMFISEVISYGIYFEIWHKAGVESDNPSPFMSHIRYSLFLAMTALLLINRIFYEKNSAYKRIVMFIFFMTVTTNLFINVGRTGEIAFFVGFFLLILSHLSYSFKNIILAFSTLAVIFFFAYALSPVVDQRINDAKSDIVQWQEKGVYDTSLGGRFAMWDIGFDIIKENPLMGVGIGDDYDTFMARVKEKKFEKFQFVNRYTDLHNQYIQTMVRGGVIGLFFLLLLFFTIFRQAKKEAFAFHLAIILLSVYLLGFITEPILIHQFTTALFSFMVALIAVQIRQEG